MPKFKKNPNTKSAMYKKAYKQPPLPMVEGTKAHKDALAKAGPVKFGRAVDALQTRMEEPSSKYMWGQSWTRDKGQQGHAGNYEQFEDYWE